MISDRLDRWLPHARFDVEGQPVDLAGALELARIDKYQFQWWATWLCGGHPHSGERKGRDRGIDGTLEFVSRRGEHDWGVISVKGGKNVGPAMARELHGTVEREKASLGVLICLARPTRDMELEALGAGFVELGGQSYRRLQIRTIEQLFAGQAIDCPFLLTTVQSTPGSARGPRRVAISPEDLQKQRNLLLSFVGGKAKADKAAAPARDLFGDVPAVAGRRRRA